MELGPGAVGHFPEWGADPRARSEGRSAPEAVHLPSKDQGGRLDVGPLRRLLRKGWLFISLHVSHWTPQVKPLRTRPPTPAPRQES